MSYMVVDTQTMKVLSIRSTAEAAFALASLLQDTEPYQDAKLEVVKNPYGGSD